MTRKNLEAHKRGNQRRKEQIMHMARHGHPDERGYWASKAVIQNGKFTPKHT